MNATAVDTRDRGTIALQIIAQNWGLQVAESIQKEVKSGLENGLP